MTSVDTPSSLWLGNCSQNLLELDSFYEKKLPEALGKDFIYSGEYHTAFFAIPQNFHPFSNDLFVSSLWELCTGSLGQLKVGYYETMAPYLADEIIEEKLENKLIYHVSLNTETYWEEIDLESFGFENVNSAHFQRTPLSSHDFKFYVEAFKNPYVHLPKAVSLRNRYQNLKEIKVIDAKHFDVIWEFEDQIPYGIAFLTAQLKPLPKHIYFHLPDGRPIYDGEFADHSHYLFAQHFCNHWAQALVVSCGPWIFQSKSFNQITLVRNHRFHHPYIALMDKMIFHHKSSPISAWQAFKAGELTSCFLSPLQLKDFKDFQSKVDNVKILEYFSKMYYFIGWNQRNPLFESTAVRQALSHAIHREKLIEHFFKGKAQKLTGPFMPGSFSYDESVLAEKYDPQKAVELLEKEGWYQSQVLGVREKQMGSKSYAFRFHLNYFLNSELSQAICQFISTSLKEIGIDCQPQGLTYNEFMQRYEQKNFDAIYMAWSLAPPPENPWSLWHSEEADKMGSSNIIGFKNKEVDSYLEALQYASNPQERQQIYHQLHQKIHALHPYAFLFVPSQLFVYYDELQNVYIPKREKELFADANIEELCPKIFYIQTEKF